MTAGDHAVRREIADWPDRLEAACEGTRFDASRVRVVTTCDSTQDLARTLGCGAVVTTGRQVAGRGRLGRRWADDSGLGIAVSLAVEPTDSTRLSLAAGLAAVEAVVEVRPAAAARVGLKFPNDLVDRASGRKLAGVLVESDADAAIIGIGINVETRDWPEELGAIALADLVAGDAPARIEVLETLVPRLDEVLDRPLDDLAARFRSRHAPTGGRVEVETPTGLLRGALLDLDPLGELDIRDVDGTRHRPLAARARIVSWTPPGPGA